ncbi:hypothetical protein A2154_04735 [Candidatus Gottesmanbacteria bacterium RBG_16_43_7]|uniref:Uncharacterized protein n=1 Tax=Candidatus Gottesmanbacteria bacterium RBG_16_43_7 TaxID=1798373 RepID=A0A1F5Z8K0_9BACT|nr:MAG: hypothetical protein A2154_04735 [Candidatus Gottesmanbacteria bacterium RBG_16_43_7]
MAKERLLPITYAGGYTPRFSVDIPFPSWLDADSIGVDLPLTIVTMNMAGITNLDIKGQNKPEVRKSVPMIASVSPDGSATAARGGFADPNDFFLTDLDSRNRSFLHNVNWCNASIQIDIDSLAKRVEQNKGSLRHPAEWVPHLNTALRDGLRKVGTKHLLWNLKWHNILWASWINT